MKTIAFVCCFFAATSAFAQFSGGDPAIGVYYGPVLQFNRYNGIDQIWISGEPEYNFHRKNAYSQTAGLRLTIPASDAFQVNVGLNYTNRRQQYEQTVKDGYPGEFADPYDTLFNVTYSGSFVELHGELKQHVYQPGRFSIFYTFGAGFSFLYQDAMHVDARPFEGDEIKDYKVEMSGASNRHVLFHAGLGFDYELSDYLFLTVQPQYVFYAPGDFYGTPYTVHTGRINIGLSYTL